MNPAESRASGAPAHEWLRPRLQALLRAAERAGLGRESVVAAMIDIVTSEPFDEANTVEAAAPRAVVADDATPPDAAALEFDAEIERGIRDEVERDLRRGLGESLY